MFIFFYNLLMEKITKKNSEKLFYFTLRNRLKTEQTEYLQNKLNHLSLKLLLTVKCILE